MLSRAKTMHSRPIASNLFVIANFGSVFYQTFTNVFYFFHVFYVFNVFYFYLNVYYIYVLEGEMKTLFMGMGMDTFSPFLTPLYICCASC